MNNTTKIRINPLPVITWNKLRLNDSVVELPAGSLYPSDAGETAVNGIPSGMGDELAAYLRRAGVSAEEYDLTKDNDKLKINVKPDREELILRELRVSVGAGKNALVRIDIDPSGEYCSGKDASGENEGAVSAIRTLLHVREGANAVLVQYHRPGKGDTILSDTGIVLEKGAKVSIFHLFPGTEDEKEAPGKVYAALRADLAGEGSELTLNGGYRLGEDALLDMNYVVNHIAPKTLSNLDLRGSLHKNANKTFRGTIDLKKGCSGSKGVEIEDVLFMDDDVVNRTIPLILCSEEDVEGDHGAMAGKIAPDQLYYLCSRGLSEAAAVKMLEDGRIASVIHAIPDENTASELNRKIFGEEGK